MKNYCLLCVFAVFLTTGCANKSIQKAPVSLTWEMGANREKGYYDNSFIIKNNTDKPLDNRWVIYYAQLPTTIEQPADAPLKIEPVNGNFFRIYPSDTYQPIAPGDSLRVTFVCQYSILKESQAPEGIYFVADKDGTEQIPLAVGMTVVPFNNRLQWSRPGTQELPYPDGNYIYQQNERFTEPVALAITDIFPSVKNVTARPGKGVIGNNIQLNFIPEFESEAALLTEKLQQVYQLSVRDSATTVISLELLPKDFKTVNDEHYILGVNNGRITIQGNTPHAVFNGTQTLLGMLKNVDFPLEVENLTISDYPDLTYRGMMLDIARDFTTKENLLKLIDRLSSYKLNALHFHFSDDEGWRLEIPGLEELTAVGSRRGHTLDEQECLYPAYDGCFDPNDDTGTSNGYYTRADFIDILKYARDRHIQVIPEIEMPGHARAAIVSMKARYNKYIGTDKGKATEYLLHDLSDTSKYYSVQAYTDNVMNVALPSTYRFIEKVVDELAAMYKDAGITLATVHVGGDEVPEGVWIGSPACQDYMAENQLADVPALSSHFLMKLNDILKSRDITLSGWQEVAEGHTDEMDKILTQNIGGVYCWTNTLPGEEAPYRAANKGYDVILCNVNCFYMDMSYNKHPQEPGLYWGGFVNEFNPFNMQPYNIYRAARNDMSGNPIDLQKAGQGKVLLNESARGRIKGVQAQVFAETIRNYDMVEYYIFPKIFGVVERGWNAEPAWMQIKDPKAEEMAYQKALELYNAKIGQGELPRLSKEKINFRVAQAGIIVKEGMLYANTPIYGAEIRYTTDGSEPTQASALWEKPVPCEAEMVKARLFWQGRQSVTTSLE